MLGSHVICETRFPDVSEIFLVGRSNISKTNLIKSWPFLAISRCAKSGHSFDRHGCRCSMPTFPIRGRAMKARDGSFAWTACNLWNLLPRSVRDISGRKVEYFKNKLDKILTAFSDIPRCAKSGHSFDRHGRSKSNSLCDHYRNRFVRQELNRITTV